MSPIRPRGLRRPPNTDSPQITSYLDEVKKAIEGLPFSFFSTPNGPNASNVTAPKGTLGIEIGSAATTLWIKEDDGSSGWASVSTT